MEIDTSPRVMTRGRCKELTSGGGPYFKVTYKKRGVNLPEVETLVYLGSTQVKLDGELQTRFVFNTRGPTRRMAVGSSCRRSDAKSSRRMAQYSSSLKSYCRSLPISMAW
jgi:hypothetical protein